MKLGVEELLDFKTRPAVAEQIALDDYHSPPRSTDRDHNDYRFAAHFAKSMLQETESEAPMECYMCFYEAEDFATLAKHCTECHVPKSERVSQDTERCLNNESTETIEDDRPPSNSRNWRGL